MKKIAILFGGKSTEHDVSIVSGTSVISNMDKSKYEIFPIYIDKSGDYYKYTKNVEYIKILKLGETINELEKIENIIDYLNNVDVVFPVLHGKNGEDGTIQGMLELIGISYIGCKVLSSSICMDKVYTKVILDKAGIEQAKYMYIKKYNDKYIYVQHNFNELVLDSVELVSKVKDYLNFPVFIKPSNSGSSVGVNKSLNESDFIDYLEYAFKYDNKVLIEEAINGREVECAVLGNDDLMVSSVGEVLAAGEFYSFDSKYNNSESITVIPANLDEYTIENIRKLAKKAFKACDCKGLSRIDFFVENNTNRIILNEINTLPGFTEISMYPKLMDNVGISYSELIDRLLELAE